MAAISVAGTPHYMSPEQVRDDPNEPVDARSDLWSVGVCMYQMLSARLPFGGTEASAIAIMGDVQRAEFIDLRDLEDEGMPRISDGVAEQVVKALHKHPSQRCQTATEMHKELMDALEDNGDTKYDSFLSYRVWSEGSDAPGNGYCPRIFDLLSSQEIQDKTQGGKTKRAVVYLDKVRLIDGQAFDKGFMKGLGNSAVFVPLLSRRALEKMLLYRPDQADFVDFVLVEYIVALALLWFSSKKKIRGSVHCVFPLCIGDEKADGTQSDEFFNELLRGCIRTETQLLAGASANDGVPVPDFVSQLSCDKADELLHNMDDVKGRPLRLPAQLRISVKEVLKKLTSFQLARLHMDATLPTQELSVRAPSTSANSQIVGGRYAVIQKLGQGSFGTVTLVRDMDAPSEDDELACKSLQCATIQEANQYLHEAMIHIRHPNLVACMNAVVDEGSGGSASYVVQIIME